MQPHLEWKEATLSPRAVRRHVRHLYSVPIKVHRMTAALERTTHGVTLDISEGGFAAVIEEHLDKGEMVRVDLPLSTFKLDAAAVCRYATSSRSGFEFLNLSPEARQRITAAGELYPT